jgi:Bacteriophage minor capsid protein
MAGSFDTPPSDIIRRALIALGHGNDPPNTTWPIYIALLPDVPDNAAVVYDQTGRDRGRNMTGERTEMHGIQVVIRSKSTQYIEGYVKSRNIAVAFDNFSQYEITISGHRYVIWSATRTTEVIDAGQEETVSKRRMFSVNAVVNIRQKS